MEAAPTPKDSHYHPNTLTPTHNHKRWLERSPEFKRRLDIRNERIVRMYASEPMTAAAIATRFGLSEGRIKAIISKYAHIIEQDKAHEKLKRINRLRRLDDSTQSERMALDVVRELREEFEGTPAAVTNVTVVSQVVFESPQERIADASVRQIEL